MSNSKFFENKECEYYPCHKGLDEINCMFCYCPFYSWKECPGKNEYKEKEDGRRVKVCTNCTFSHDKNNYDEVIKYLKLGEDAFYKEQHKIDCKFYGIGVGPGEASLITKQAEDIIKAVDVLILPAKDRESCRAYVIAEKAIPHIKGKECIFIPFPMSMKEPELSQFHRNVANQVETILDENKSVGFLSIGDVSIYSTFVYVEELVSADGYATEYISGIPSFCAAAGRLGIPLTLGNEQMHIIPGSADIDEALSLKGTLIFMKSGKRLIELKQRLLSDDSLDSTKVYAVSNCGMDNEIISIGAENISEESGYLTVVVVKNDR